MTNPNTKQKTPFTVSCSLSWKQYKIEYRWVYGEDHNYSRTEYVLTENGKEPVIIRFTSDLLDYLFKPNQYYTRLDLYDEIVSLQERHWFQMKDEVEQKRQGV